MRLYDKIDDVVHTLATGAWSKLPDSLRESAADTFKKSVMYGVSAIYAPKDLAVELITRD